LIGSIIRLIFGSDRTIQQASYHEAWGCEAQSVNHYTSAYGLLLVCPVRRSLFGLRSD